MSTDKKRILVLVSGGGTNLQALIDACADGRIKSGCIAGVVSSKPGVFALERAEKAGIPTSVVERSYYNDRTEFTKAIMRAIDGYGADLVVLAGFMCILDPVIFSVYENRIINVHPALIPSFCGDGYYGLRVHRAALDRGVKVTGATVHFVDAVTDGGPIILQKAVYINEGDTPETLQKRVMEEAEHVILPEAVELYCSGSLTVSDGIVHIRDAGQPPAFIN